MNSNQLYDITLFIRNEVKRFTKDKQSINNETLCGACAIASVALHDSLRQLHVQSIIVEGSFESTWNFASHCWVETTKYVLDPTATQFNEFRRSTWPDVLVIDRQKFFKIRTLPKFYEIKKGQDAIEHLTQWWTPQNFQTYCHEIHSCVNKCVKKFSS